jgi:hypothetical protein
VGKGEDIWAPNCVETLHTNGVSSSIWSNFNHTWSYHPALSGQISIIHDHTIRHSNMKPGKAWKQLLRPSTHSWKFICHIYILYIGFIWKLRGQWGTTPKVRVVKQLAGDPPCYPAWCPRQTLAPVVVSRFGKVLATISYWC